MELKSYDRKPFSVTAVQVTLQNVDEVAKWCKGEVVMVPTKFAGTVADLPTVKLPGNTNKGMAYTATLGCYVVELRGSFRVYKEASFLDTFVEKVEEHETPAPIYVPDAESTQSTL
jgi:hypothetical protein